MANVIEVDIRKVGQRKETAVLNGDRTLAEALRVGGFTLGPKEEAHVDGQKRSLDYELEDGDIITIVAASVKGGVQSIN